MCYYGIAIGIGWYPRLKYRPCIRSEKYIIVTALVFNSLIWLPNTVCFGVTCTRRCPYRRWLIAAVPRAVSRRPRRAPETETLKIRLVPLPERSWPAVRRGSRVLIECSSYWHLGSEYLSRQRRRGWTQYRDRRGKLNLIPLTHTCTFTHTSIRDEETKSPVFYWMLCLLFSILFSQQSAFAGNGVINSLRTKSAFLSAEYFFFLLFFFCTVQFRCAHRGFIFCKLHFDLPKCFQSCWSFLNWAQPGGTLHAGLFIFAR